MERFQETQGVSNESGRHADVKATRVEDLPQEFVEIGYDHICHLLERNWVLPLGQVGLTKEDENGFDAGCDSLLDACFVLFEDFGIDGIVHKEGLRRGYRYSLVVEDASSFGACFGSNKGCLVTAQGLVPLEPIEVLSMFASE